jgi:tight adherence protein B
VLTVVLLLVLACLLWPGRSGSSGSSYRPSPPRVGDPTPRVPAVLGRLSAAGWPGRRGRADGWVADFAEVVAIGLEAGLDLPSAALASARSPTVLARAPWLAGHLEGEAARGRGVTTLLEAEPDVTADERRDLSVLVAAWRLAEMVGAAASAVTASAASSVRDRRAAAERTAVVVAGPRASMVLLSALPLAGPVAALAVGLPPARLYDSAASQVLAVVGLALTAAGWWWSRWLLRRACRPGHTDGTAR